MDSTLLPMAERLRHRRQEDAKSIFSSHNAMMLCRHACEQLRRESSPRRKPCPPSPPPSMSIFWHKKATYPVITENQAILFSP